VTAPEQAAAAPPQLSPDGHWWWDGASWVPAAVRQTSAAAPVSTVPDPAPVGDFFSGPVAPQAHHPDDRQGWPPLATGSYPAEPGYGPAYGRPGAVPPAPSGRSWVAVTALVFGILPFWPAALIVGACGLAHVKRTGKQGRNLAIAGIVLGVVWLLAFAAWEVLDGKKDYQDLATGDCIASSADLSGRITDVPTVSCSKQHALEVFATYEDPVTERPTVASVRLDCAGRIGDYATATLGLPSLRLGVIIPEPDSWAGGERTIVCLVEGPPRTGSYADPGRPS
jgi:hypothetical protein